MTAVPSLPSGLEQDPIVYEAMRQLALDSIETARELLQEAAPAQQLHFLRIILPRLMGSITQGAEDDQAELKRQLDEMMAEVRKGLGDV